jgi:hypothetical protein
LTWLQVIERINLILLARNVQIICSTFLLLLVAGCVQSAESCPPATPADLSDAEMFVQDESLPFRFPLDDLRDNFGIDAAYFADFGQAEDGIEYHAAEDIYKPAGTLVYAMADGQISYSGRMGGYGWLIIIDHPQANLYSLYGHLSPSRWRLESGQVKKGDLIAYLGDSDENGGTRENPLRTHLHLGVRVGQRSDYPARGEWRWMAGWIKPCPQDLDWLQPSIVIASQDIPQGGFLAATSSFVEKWAVEILLGGVYLIGAVSMFIFGTKRDKPYIMLLTGGVLLAAGLYFYTAGWKMSYVMLGSAIILASTGVVMLVRRYANSLSKA